MTPSEERQSGDLPASPVSAIASRINITPEIPLDMGSGPRRESVRLENPVREPLEANVLVLRFGDDGSDVVVLVTLDVLYPGPVLRAAVEEAAVGVDPSRIVVAASHTHRAPFTVPGATSLGVVSPEYLTDVSERLGAEVSRLLAVDQPAPARLRVGAADAHHSINRRRRKWFLMAKRPRWNFIANAPNPHGPTDEVITTMTVEALDGTPIAHLWNYACHPVSHPNPSTYSGHYPHVVRSLLRSRRTDLPVLFFQGFSGDTRPRASARVHQLRELIRRALSGPLFDDMTWRNYTAWADSLAVKVREAIDSSVRSDAKGSSCERLVVPGAELATGSKPFVFQALRIGSELQIIAMNAEPVVEYARLIRSWGLSRWTMCVGCIDDVTGYVPTNVMIHEGGYESDRSRPHFGVGEYVGDYQQRIEAGLRGVSEKVAPQ